MTSCSLFYRSSCTANVTGFGHWAAAICFGDWYNWVLIPLVLFITILCYYNGRVEIHASVTLVCSSTPSTHCLYNK